MQVVIIDYGAGNIQSIQFAFRRLGVEAILSQEAALIKSADRVIFPGVGAANAAMQKLKETGLNQIIPQLQQPVLGICLGMQLLCSFTQEGNTQGLGIFEAKAQRFPDTVKVPQIGWNAIKKSNTSLLAHLPEKAYMYFLHSYYVENCPESISTSDYGLTYTAALHKNNFYGVQFHPEKSAQEGEQILKNFLQIDTV